MNKIICSVPDCGYEVDTSAACTDVISLMGLRVFLQSKIENEGSDLVKAKELSNYLDTINRHLLVYFKDDQDIEKQIAKRQSKTNRQNASASTTNTLYLQCKNPKPCPDGHHRGQYNVECIKILVDGDK